MTNEYLPEQFRSEVFLRKEGDLSEKAWDADALKAWEERMNARPGVAKGKDVPEPSKLTAILKEGPEAAEKYAAQSRAWIQASMKEDAKK